MDDKKVEFIKSIKGEITGLKINEPITIKELIKHFVKPEIKIALTKQKEEFEKMLKEKAKPFYFSKTSDEEIMAVSLRDILKEIDKL